MVTASKSRKKSSKKSAIRLGTSVKGGRSNISKKAKLKQESKASKGNEKNKKNKKTKKTKKIIKQRIFKEKLKNNLKDFIIEDNLLFNTILSNFTEHIYWFDTSNVFLGCNEQQAIDLGLSSSEKIIGKTLYDFLPAKDADVIIKNNNQVMKTKKLRVFEEIHTPINTQPIEYLSYKMPLFDANRKVVGILGISIDITKQKQKEKELLMAKNVNQQINKKRQKFLNEKEKLVTGKKIKENVAAETRIDAMVNYLENIIALTPGHVYWKDKKGHYLGCNNALAKSIGLSSHSEIIGMTDRDIAKKLGWSLRLGRAHLAQDMKIIKTGEPVYNLESPPLKRADGTSQILLGNKVPIKDEHGEVIGVVGISIDITARKAMEEAARKAQRKAEQADAVKSQFIKNMEHDLRTPASGIASLAELLFAREKNKDKKETLGLLSDAGRQLLNILNSILEFDRINYGAFPVLEKRFNIKRIVENVVKLELPSAKMKGLQLSGFCSVELPTELIGDEFRISRMLINLVSNSIKFTDKGHVKIVIAGSKIRGRNLLLRISVEDSGVGIPKDKQNFIFEKFNKITPSNTGLYPGSGLGLYIVKRFINDLDGEIELESSIRRGTKFTIYVPCKVPLSAKNNKNSKNGKNSKKVTKIITEMPSEVKSEKTADLSNKFSLLLVEDDKIAQTVANNILQEIITEDIELAESGRQCMKKIHNKIRNKIKSKKKNKYDLIFLDIGLPDTTGLELVREIRHFKEFSTIPIIALTAHDDKDIRKACFSAGFSDFLVKPIDKERASNIFKKWLCKEKVPQEYEKKAAFISDKKITSKKTDKTNKKIDEKSGKQTAKRLGKKSIDLELGKKLMGGNEKLALDMLKEFNKCLNEHLRIIKQAFISEDFERLRMEVHKLRGAACYCGTPGLKEYATKLETAIKAGNFPIEKLYRQLCREILAVQKEYSKLQ